MGKTKSPPAGSIKPLQQQPLEQHLKIEIASSRVTSSRSDHTQIPAPVRIVPIQEEGFDQDPHRHYPGVREQAQFDARLGTSRGLL